MCGCETILAYDVNIILSNLVNQGMTEEEAEEFYQFNIVGAYMGIYQPTYIEKFE